MKMRVYRKMGSLIGVAFFVLLCCGLGGCFGRGIDPPKELGSDVMPDNTSERGGNQSYVPNELVGIFETEAEAQDAAELYGIELTSYSNKIAVFSCEGDPIELIEQGEKNGWPQLSLNRIYTTHDVKDRAEKRSDHFRIR